MSYSIWATKWEIIQAEPCTRISTATGCVATEISLNLIGYRHDTALPAQLHACSLHIRIQRLDYTYPSYKHEIVFTKKVSSCFAKSPWTSASNKRFGPFKIYSRYTISTSQKFDLSYEIRRVRMKQIVRISRSTLALQPGKIRRYYDADGEFLQHAHLLILWLRKTNLIVVSVAGV